LLIWPSWLVSISLNSSLLPDFEDEAPAPALFSDFEAELPPAADDVPAPVDDDVPPSDEDLLLCDIEGDELELDLLFVASSAYADAAAKASSEKPSSTDFTFIAKPPKSLEIGLAGTRRARAR
jgi:hypothetical protein